MYEHSKFYFIFVYFRSRRGLIFMCFTNWVYFIFKNDGWNSIIKLKNGSNFFRIKVPSLPFQDEKNSKPTSKVNYHTRFLVLQEYVRGQKKIKKILVCMVFRRHVRETYAYRFKWLDNGVGQRSVCRLAT